MSFQAPYISKEELRTRASTFLAEHNSGGNVPLDIERIIEANLGMDIVPMPGLQESYDIDGFITRDLTEIRVDEYVYLNREHRYRFTLAHELGHKVLHGELWQSFDFHSVAEWKEAVTASIPEKEYSYIEFHANTFAGLILVPPVPLATSFAAAIEMVRSVGLDPRDEATGVREHVEKYIGKEFKVSGMVVHRRLEADQLWNEV